MEFWDTGDYRGNFDFDAEKKLLIENMEYLANMSVEEQTLYKKWVELQDVNTIKQKSLYARLYDWQWKPTDIMNREQTIREIENLQPVVQIVDENMDASKWVRARKMIHTMSWTANPGRNMKVYVLDSLSNKLLGQISIASDVTSLGVRDKYIGWEKDNKFKEGKLNHTAIASTIVCTQPLGYNFLGGKLIAMMATTAPIRDYWEEKYGQKLITIGTTSLYGIHSQYNGIPHYKTLGESKGMVSMKPDDSFYEPWHQWLKENRSEWYQKNITDERLRNGESMGIASGPVNGIKQKILGKIFKEIDVNPKTYNHGFRRGIYLAQMYENGNEFLCSKIDETELKMKQKFEENVEYITKWWKPKAIRRYTKLFDNGRIKPECLFYHDAIGTTWDIVRDKYLQEVGR
jgi:hypothetical protein